MSLFKLIKYKIGVFDEVYILSQFNIDYIVSLSYELNETVGETKYFISSAPKL
jgi:hypothetical protein